MFARIVVALLAVAFSTTPTFAQKQKKAELNDFPFWTAPKQAHTHAFVPGLQAALELTPEQIEKISAARAATVDSAEIRALKQKGDPNATADERATAGAKRAEAIEKLHKEVAAILTPAQNGLIEKLNDSFAKTAAEVHDSYQADFVAAKGNAEEMLKVKKECAEAVVAAFNKKLDILLNAEQRKAVEKAAEEEAKRAAANKDKPKPGK